MHGAHAITRFTSLVLVLLLAACGGEIGGELGGDGQHDDDSSATDGEHTTQSFHGSTFPGGVSTKVNGRTLNTNQQKSLRYVADKVVPALTTYYGSRGTALDRASLVAWWALKEGAMDLDNPIAYSLCDRPRVNLTSNPTGVCSRHAWQVGIAAIQAPRPPGSPDNWFTSSVSSYINTYEDTAREVFPGKSAAWALQQVALDAGYNESTIVGSTGYARAAWLLRIGAVGYVHEYPTINEGCVNNSASWCFSTAWYPSSVFAPNRSAMVRARADIRAILDVLAPACYGGVYGANNELFKDMTPGMTGYDEAKRLYDANVTSGCQASPCRLFCPTAPMTRGQMAAFITRAAKLPIPPSPPPFADIPPSHTLAAEIAAVAAAGITHGCGDGSNYCPDRSVTRGEMAAFIVRARGWSSYTTDKTFSDVPPSHRFYEEIMILATQGVTQGYGDGTFRPEQEITRGQMAVFLARAFNL